MTSTLERALALDILTLARHGGMPEAFWATDQRIARACTTLGIRAEEALHHALADTLHTLDHEPTSPADMALDLEVWTDGACRGNPGPGGWGWITNEPGDLTRSGYGSARETTNQRMEALAAIEALTALPQRPITVVSDSSYVVNAFNKRWYVGWTRNNRWANSQGKPVANRDLWEVLLPLGLATLPDGSPAVSFRWVKGHAGNTLNEAADRLAVRGRDEAARRLA